MCVGRLCKNRDKVSLFLNNRYIAVHYRHYRIITRASAKMILFLASFAPFIQVRYMFKIGCGVHVKK